MSDFNGLGMHLGNLSRLSKAKTRSISAENPTGEKGKGGMATEGAGADASGDRGRGWKVSPCIRVPAGETLTLAEIEGPGAIQQIWMTLTGSWRNWILRVWWDGEDSPSIECPAGDFFCCGWGRFAQVNALPVNVNPGSAFNCFWEMPFRKSARITLENRDTINERQTAFFQINYTLTDVPGDAAYLHAQFRRSNPLAYKQLHTLLDGVRGWGQYVGTYMAWQVNSNGWWGEGEIKFHMDGDGEFPTICGTGTEDYFGGSYNFEWPRRGDGDGPQYCEFSTPYMGMPQVIRPDGCYNANTRFGLYRFHVTDPIRFEQDLRVTMQALGWRSGGRYLPLQDDISSVAFWYQAEPHADFPALPDTDGLEII
jgi:hypothetical protein